jgi:hypothetical protein
LSISVPEEQPVNLGRAGLVYLLASLFCALFGAIYEHFSHGVFSGFMIYAFAFPLVFGALPFFAMSLAGWRLPRRLPFNLYNAGIASLTVGSIFQGVLDIYGTTNNLTAVYWVLGTGLTLIGAVLHLIGQGKSRFI